jgi:site-specific DNA-methyltransferase (adenine-specific)
VSGGYPAEKPPEVSEVLVRQSSDPGALVIDPFMGSGSVGVAAIRTGRAFAGNDLCDEAIGITRERLVDVGGVEQREAPASEEAQLGLVL